MPDSLPAGQGEAGPELADTLRQTIERFRTLLKGELPARARHRIERLLAEAEAALTEIEIPEEW